MSKGGIQYDFSFKRTDGTDIGYMLDEVNGKKRYDTFTDPALAQQFFTGEVSYGRMEPHKELAITGGNFEAGFGQEFYSSAGVNEFRYYSSKGVDARFKDNLICGPKATGIALTDYSATITDGGMELWDDANNLTNWTFTDSDGDNDPTAGGGQLLREVSIVNEGTYSARLYTVGGGVWAQIKQSLPWDTKYRGVKVTVICRVYQNVASDVELKLYDGQGTTTGATSAVTGAWVGITVTRTIDTSATELTIQIRSGAGSGGSSSYIDSISWYSPYPGYQPRAFAEFNDQLYMAHGSVLLKLNGAGDGWDYVWNLETNGYITCLTPFSDGNLYIGQVVFGKYWYMDTDENFTQSNLGAAGAYMYNSAAIGAASGQVMHEFGTIAGEVSRTTYKATNPTNTGSWSSAINVGNASEAMVDIIGDADTVYFAKEDTVWYLDSSDNDFMLVEDIQTLKRAGNCKNLISWHKKLYIPAGENGLVEYDGGIITWRSPALFMTNLSDFSGQIQALAADEEYIYAMVDNGTKIEILAGKVAVVNGTATWVWHPIQEITLEGAEVAFVSSVYKKRLWIASTSSSDSVYYIPLTTKYGDITGDSDYEFQTGGVLYTSWLHSNLKADSKGYHKLTLTTEGCDANSYITVDYQTYYTALSGTWTPLGDFTNSPTQTRYFSNVTGTMIRFRFTIVTNSTSTTPKLTNFDCRGIWRPVRRRLIGMVVKLGDESLPRTGRPSQDYKSQKEAIVEAYDKVWPNTVYDIGSVDKQGTVTTTYCNLLDYREFDVVLPEGGNPISKCELLWEEIKLS